MDSKLIFADVSCDPYCIATLSTSCFSLLRQCLFTRRHSLIFLMTHPRPCRCCAKDEKGSFKSSNHPYYQLGIVILLCLVCLHDRLFSFFEARVSFSFNSPFWIFMIISISTRVTVTMGPIDGHTFMVRINDVRTSKLRCILEKIKFDRNVCKHVEIDSIIPFFQILWFRSLIVIISIFWCRLVG